MRRPVTSPLDEHTVPIGIPCAAALQPSARRYFFVRVAPDAAAATSGAGGAHAPEPLPIPGLELGPLLAKSPHGRTYRGFLKGSPVAVKVGLLLHRPCVLLRLPSGRVINPHLGPSGPPLPPTMHLSTTAWRMACCVVPC